MKNTQITCLVEFLYKSIPRVSKLESETFSPPLPKTKKMDLGPCSFLCWVFGKTKKPYGKISWQLLSGTRLMFHVELHYYLLCCNSWCLTSTLPIVKNSTKSWGNLEFIYLFIFLMLVFCWNYFSKSSISLYY